MATIDLSNYTSVYTALFVRMDVPGYEILRYSTHYEPYTVTESDNIGYSYTNLGTLIGVSDSTFGIRSNLDEVVVTISGIPLTNVSMVLAEEIKGSKIEIRRQFFNGSSYTPIGTTVIKFRGIVNNYTILEEWPADGNNVGTCTIGFVCSNIMDLMENKRAGRRTNPLDEKIFYPSDLSMDRVPTIAGANFNFGAPK